MTQKSLPSLTTRGTSFVDSAGAAIRLRGVCLGGWLNMENVITGYSANESFMRRTVRQALGPDRYERFFERLATSFFNDADAAFLGAQGFNVVRTPVNYRHLESDAKPFEIIEDGFRHLDRSIRQCGENGIYSIIDLHALPGYQNHGWHADNPTHIVGFWDHPHFQDRVVNLWEAIATRYKDNPCVAGYNLMNEPADESREVVGPFYSRLVEAVRAIDPDHTIFLDGNTYSTEFDIFEQEWDNVVYTLHDYVVAGLGGGGPYPGYTQGVWVDRSTVAKKFLQRSSYARQTGTPILVGEFGPIYTDDPETDAQRRQILADQLEIYREHDVSWTIWMYKDLDKLGLVSVKPDSAYRRRFDDFVAKKVRLGADQWGGDGEGPVELTRPFQEMFASEFPGFDPYPWGRVEFVSRLLLNITVAQPLAYDYADLFRGLDDSELDALADSFAFENCSVRQSLLDQLKLG